MSYAFFFLYSSNFSLELAFFIANLTSLFKLHTLSTVSLEALFTVAIVAFLSTRVDACDLFIVSCLTTMYISLVLFSGFMATVSDWNSLTTAETTLAVFFCSELTYDLRVTSWFICFSLMAWESFIRILCLDVMELILCKETDILEWTVVTASSCAAVAVIYASSNVFSWRYGASYFHNRVD